MPNDNLSKLNWLKKLNQPVSNKWFKKLREPVKYRGGLIRRDDTLSNRKRYEEEHRFQIREMIEESK